MLHTLAWLAAWPAPPPGSCWGGIVAPSPYRQFTALPKNQQPAIQVAHYTLETTKQGQRFRNLVRQLISSLTSGCMITPTQETGGKNPAVGISPVENKGKT